MTPPLNPLRVFSFAARLESFTQAASELNVSQSAVSRQIGVLEGYLDVQLFRRERDGVTLTDQGYSYYQQIASAFGIIEGATDQLAKVRRTRPLKVRVYTSFAMKWLMWRLQSWTEQHPDIELQLNQTLRPVNFSRDSADLAIQFGNASWPEMNCVLLMRDQLQPVCSPKLLRSERPIRDIDDLRFHRMLRTKYQEWTDWLREVDRLDLLKESGIVFDSTILTYQGAIEGLGVAMGQLKLLQRDIDAGLLVPLFDRIVVRDFGYYVIWPTNRTPSRAASSFVNWLKQEVNV